MQNKQHLGFWFLLAFLAFFAGPLLRTGEAMVAFVQQEVRDTETALGPTLAGKMVDLADFIFQQTPAQAVTHVARRAQHTPEEQRLSAAVGGAVGLAASKMLNSYMQGLVLQTYVLTIRAAVVLFWLMFLLPMFVAIVFDGLQLRAIKRAEFGSIRPATFTLAGVVVIPLLACPLLYLTLPFSMSPLLAPLWVAVLALPLSLLISNSQPLFGR